MAGHHKTQEGKMSDAITISADAKKKAVGYIENTLHGVVERFLYDFYSFDIVYLKEGREYSVSFNLEDGRPLL